MTTPKKKRKARVVGSNKKWKRADFEANVEKHKLTVADIMNMLNRGAITDHDYLFTLDSVIDINYNTYVGAWTNCRQQKDPKSRWSREVGSTDGRQMIKEAFR